MTRPSKDEFAATIAALTRGMARYTADDLDDCLTWAEDELSVTGETKAAMLVDGMRTGIQQAREADAGARVVALWFDDNSYAIFTWQAGDGPDGSMEAIMSALKADGE